MKNGDVHMENMSSQAREAMKACPVITIEVARDMITEYDLDNDGKLCFEEFVKLLMDDRD